MTENKKKVTWIWAKMPTGVGRGAWGVGQLAVNVQTGNRLRVNTFYSLSVWTKRLITYLKSLTSTKD